MDTVGRNYMLITSESYRVTLEIWQNRKKNFTVPILFEV